jgi:4-hydroxybenzoate polyprenyltransferase
MLVLMRPRQWIKNSFVLAPLLFSGSFLKPPAVISAIFASLLFCLASSATYIVNDMHDIELDRNHPKKSRTRPLAAGVVTIPMASGLLIALYALLAWGWFITPTVAPVIIAYLLLNLAYTFVFKYQRGVDIFTIAISFVLRVYAGAAVLAVQLSAWMFVTTLCLALYLAAIKRWQELIENGSKSRAVLERYSVSLSSYYAGISAIGAFVFYCLYVVLVKPQMVITIPLVLFALYRCWNVVTIMNPGESPTDTLLADWQLMVTAMLWVGTCAIALWPH